MQKLTIIGEINKKGQFGFYNIAQLNDFCVKNPGKKLIVTIQVEDKKSKDVILAYYYAKVIPLYQDEFYKNGDIMNNTQTDTYLRSLCPITQKKSLSDLSYDELVYFMDFLKHHALTEINQFIEEVRCL